MTDAAEHVPEQRGAVQELAADPASRKRFLSMMGGAGRRAPSRSSWPPAADDDKRRPGREAGHDG